MAIRFSTALVVALALSGCAPQPDAAKPQTTLADATQAPKKKCAGEATTGSRLHSCNGMQTDYVIGENGDDFRSRMGSNAAAVPPMGRTP